MPKKSFLIIGIILTSGLLLAFFFANLFYNLETNDIYELFKKDIEREAHSLHKEIRLNDEVLYSLKGLFDGSDHVNHDEFNQVARSILARHPEIQALEWAPRIWAEDLESYTSMMKERYRDFEITERDSNDHLVSADLRDEYYPITYLVPFEENETALGYDLASSITRKQAMEWARDDAKFMATPGVRLVQDKDGGYGYLTLAPVFDGNPTTVNKRREKIKGYIVAVFKIGEVVRKSIDQVSIKHVNFKIIDITSNKKNEVLYVHNGHVGHELESSKWAYSIVEEVSSRFWKIISVPTHEYFEQKRSNQPIVIFGSLLLFTVLIVGYVGALNVKGAQIETLVTDRTSQLEQAKKELELLARVDGLTGIANRRFFDEYAEREWLRAIREQQPISMVLIDVDCFKLFNDYYGHLAGDSVLTQIAKTLSESVNRATDLVARYGGEEFVILLPNTDLPEKIANTLCGRIENLHIPHQESTVSDVVTISAGYASIVPKKNTLFNILVKASDRALYCAKKSGRNQAQQGIVEDG